MSKRKAIFFSSQAYVPTKRLAMKVKKILSPHPITLILLFTIFCIPWKQNPYVLVFRAENTKQLLLDYIDQNTFRDEHNRSCINFLYSKYTRREKVFYDTLKVHFTSNEFAITSPLNIHEQHFSWHVEVLEYYNTNKQPFQ